MKFGQLKEYNRRNMFVEKSFTKCGGKTFPRSFCKNSKLSISLNQYFKVLYILFSFYAKLGLSTNIETKLQTTCFYIIESFLKGFFCMTYEEKYFSCYALLADQIPLSGCIYL